MTRAMRHVATLMIAGIAFGLAGCGDDDDGPTAPGPNAPADTFTVASTPAFAAERLLETYSAQDVDAYDRTLTRDFRFAFSAAADPDLVTQYGNNWGIALENAATQNLFAGFTNEHGSFQPAASAITTDPFLPLVEGDPAHADSTQHYTRISITPMLLDIVLENDTGFDISSPIRLYAVRGDAAVLGTGQAPDSTLWYVRRIEDLSVPISSPTLSAAWKDAQVTTWGAVRSLYAPAPLVGLE